MAGETARHRTGRNQTGRVLTTRELNRAVLARQLLLEPAAAPPSDVAARVCGLQTAVAAAVRRHLGDGPLSQPRLVALLAADGFPKVTWTGAQLWVNLLRVPPAGTWDKPRAHLFALAEQVVGGAPHDPRPADPVVDAARELLVTRYLRAFGPASPADVASFTGISITEVRAVLDRCDVRTFRTEAGRALVDVRDAPLPDAGTPAPVRFLGTWDAVLLAHARRTQLLPEALRPRVFATSMPRSVPTFLVDGQVAGTWSYDGGQVVVAPFHDLPTAARRAVAEEAERLAAFHTASE